MAITADSPNVDNYFVGKGIVYWKGDGETEYRDLGNVPEFEVALTTDKLDHFSSREGTRKKDRTIVREQSGTVRMVLEELTAKNLELALMGSSSAEVALSTTADTHTNTTLDNLLSTTGLVHGRRYSVAGAGIPAGDTMVWNDITNVGTLEEAATATATGVSVTITAAVAMDIFSETEKKGAIRFVGTNDVGAKVTYELNAVSLTPTSSFNPISDEWGNFEVTGELLTDAFGKFGQVYYDTAGEATP